MLNTEELRSKLGVDLQKQPNPGTGWMTDNSTRTPCARYGPMYAEAACSKVLSSGGSLLNESARVLAQAFDPHHEHLGHALCVHVGQIGHWTFEEFIDRAVEEC